MTIEENKNVNTDELEEDEFDAAFDAYADGSGPEIDIDANRSNESDEVSEQEPEANESSDHNEEQNLLNEAEPVDSGFSFDDLPDQAKKHFKSLQEKNDELEHSVQSNNGRIAALQKKLATFSYSDSKQDEENTNDDLQDDQLPEIGENEIKEFEEDYPSIFKAVRRMVDNSNQSVNAVIDKKVQPLQQQEYQRYIDNQISALESDIPDWKEVVNNEGFKSWLGNQPEPVQQMMNSVEAKDYAYLINGYKSTQSSNAANIQSNRQKKLAANVAVPSSGASKKAIAPDDFDSAFDFYAENG